MMISHHDSKAKHIGWIASAWETPGQGEWDLDSNTLLAVVSHQCSIYCMHNPYTLNPTLHNLHALQPDSKVFTDAHKPCTEPQQNVTKIKPNRNPNLSKIGAQIATCDDGKKLN